MIPPNVAQIKSYTCNGLSSITSIEIPPRVQSIYIGAFFNGVNLVNVTIGESVGIRSEYAFYNCESISSIEFLGDLKSIHTYAFAMTSVWHHSQFQRVSIKSDHMHLKVVQI